MLSHAAFEKTKFWQREIPKLKVENVHAKILELELQYTTT